MSIPWMPLYVADYLADTGHLTTLEHGAYLLLIMTYWRKGGLPDDDAQLARIVRLPPDEWANVRSTIVQLFGNGWKHKRIDAELERSAEKSNKASLAGKRSADARFAQRTFNGRSTDAPTDGQLSQPQPQSQEIRDADASLVNEPVDPAGASEKKALREGLQAFGEAWNELAASLRMPSIDEIKSGSTRERHALARLREMDPDGARDLLARIRGSPYLRGEVNGFRCTFDWIVNASNFQKIMEGNYEDRKITQLRR